MGIKLPVDKAWEGFCEKFEELQKQGRTIAESFDGRYRITLDAFDVSAHVMVFDYDDPVYDEIFVTKDKFEDELVYLYDLYIDSYEAEESDDDDEADEDDDDVPVHVNSYTNTGKNADLSLCDLSLDEFLETLSPGITYDDQYEDLRAYVVGSIKDVILDWGYVVVNG
jgi:hypothetical protein